jgi:hypothetical protein
MNRILLFTDIISNWRIRPYGAYALANTMRMHNYSTMVVDYLNSFTLSEIEKIIDKSLDENSLLVGYSFTFYDTLFGIKVIDLEKFKSINQYIKKNFPKVKIIVGGGQSKRFQTELKYQPDNLGVDFIMHGYAESMLPEVCDYLSQGLNPKFSNIIKGVKIIDHDIKASSHDFRNFSHKWHDTDIVQLNEPLSIEVARGCVFKCKYCSYPLLGKKKNDDSYIKTEEILLAEILENYERFNTTAYTVLDDTFNERTDKIELMCRVRDRSKIDLSFVGYNRLDLIHRKPEQLPLLRDMNWIGFNFGIESLNYNSAKVIGKGIKPDDVLKTLRSIKEIYKGNVIIQTNFIFGLPYDTPATVDEWLKIVLADDFPADAFAFNPLIFSDSFETSGFMANPSAFGYKIDPLRRWAWSTENWDFDSAAKLAAQVVSDVQLSPKTRIMPFRIPSAIKLGFSMDQIFNISIKDLTKLMLDEQREEKFKKQYINGLFNKLQIY